MTVQKKKVVMLAATPLTIHFFLKPHLLALAKQYQVTLMLNLKNDNYLPNLDLPIEIIDIPIARKIAPFADFLTLYHLNKLFRTEQYDLLITVVPKAGLLGMLAGAWVGIPSRLHIFQGEVWANRRGIGRWLLKTCDQITAFFSTHRLAVSDSEKQFLAQEKVVNINKIEVLGKGSIGGVDLDRFAPNPSKRIKVRKDLNIPQDATLMVFMGRLVSDKGIFELIEAFLEVARQDQTIYLLLVGPDEEGELTNINHQLGDLQQRVRRVTYTSEPEKYLASADFLCLPSHREGFGVVIIEAAAMGLPSIGSKIYGISDAILDQDTGILFECQNISQLVDAIRSLSSNKDLRNSMGERAKLNVEKNFGSHLVVGNYIRYIDQLLLE